MYRTPGQVGYEAMRDLMQERDPVPKVAPFDDSTEARQAADYLNGVWSAQPQELRDDWERVASAILARSY